MIIENKSSVGVLLTKGLTDGLWRISVVSNYLTAHGFESHIVVDEQFYSEIS